MPTLTQDRRATPTSEDDRDPVAAAFWVLRIAFFLVPLAAGLDKLVFGIVHWHQFLWKEVPRALPGGEHTVMQIVGSAEIAIGLLVLLLPRIGAPVAAAWLTLVTVDLAIVSATSRNFWDIVLRDAGLALSALALAILTARYGPVARRQARARGFTRA